MRTGTLQRALAAIAAPPREGSKYTSTIFNLRGLA